MFSTANTWRYIFFCGHFDATNKITETIPNRISENENFKIYVMQSRLY